MSLKTYRHDITALIKHCYWSVWGFHLGSHKLSHCLLFLHRAVCLFVCVCVCVCSGLPLVGWDCGNSILGPLKQFPLCIHSVFERVNVREEASHPLLSWCWLSLSLDIIISFRHPVTVFFILLFMLSVYYCNWLPSPTPPPLPPSWNRLGHVSSERELTASLEALALDC